MISEQTIQQAALLLGEAAKTAQVILFGSYVRGLLDTEVLLRTRYHQVPLLEPGPSRAAAD